MRRLRDRGGGLPLAGGAGEYLRRVSCEAGARVERPGRGEGRGLGYLPLSDQSPRYSCIYEYGETDCRVEAPC